MINIVIPMAGKGERFVNAGYTTPKPFIDVNGKSMIESVLDNLKIDNARFILLARSEHLEKEKDLVDLIKDKYEVIFIPVDKITEGMVCTILLAEKLINNNDKLLLASCDQLVDVSIKTFIEDAENRNLDGSLMTFHATDPKWSFVKIDETELALEVKEKDPISTHANVGIYYYLHGKDFVNASNAMIEKNDRVNNEFYAAPTYNYAIKNGAKVGIYEIKSSEMHGLGTPEDLEEFLRAS